MGVIYIVESPSGKCYVGQTIHNLEKRWKEHIEDANNPSKDHCKLLNKAIRKYGGEKFNKRVLAEVDDCNLNKTEEDYIKQFNSVSPFGYNIKHGGSSSKHHEDTKKKISQSLLNRHVSVETREKYAAKKSSNLPMYVIEKKVKGILVGYRVCNHPFGKDRCFTSKGRTLEENLQLAIDYLDTLNKLEAPIENTPRVLPKYVQYYKHGYVVKLPGMKAKYFLDRKYEQAELHSMAINFLTTNSVQRLNGSGLENAVSPA